VSARFQIHGREGSLPGWYHTATFASRHLPAQSRAAVQLCPTRRRPAAYLWTVESSVLGVHLPLTRESLLQDRLERRLCLVPDGEVTHPLAGITGRQADLVVESEWLVDSIKEVESVLDLLLDLVNRTKDVR
jgi:hypothetical protein